MTRIHRWVMTVALTAGGLVGFGSATDAFAQSSVNPATVRVITSFDPGWRFINADPEGAEKVGFDDTAWRKLDVPHDWSIEGPYDQNAPTRGSGGFLPTGVGWYRKTFTVPADDSKKLAFIEFDGVMANSDVWINGFHLGKRPYGFSSFRYDMTGHLNYGPDKTNVLAVRADDSQQPASRFYIGAGIYRHVRMSVTDPVHIDQWATFITTPQVSAGEATVHVQTSVMNSSDAANSVSIQTTLLDPSGKAVASAETPAQAIAAGASGSFEQDIKVASPRIWDLQHTNLYHAITSVRSNAKSIDDDVNTFGIRTFEFKSDTGFWLDGKNFKLLGVCVHSEGGAFGAAVPLGVWEHRLNSLKSIGVNAIRTAHNPPAPEFLDLCDRMGILVMDESFDCWTVGKSTYDYHVYFRDWWERDVRDYVMRDRNHPSIILYSSGNEIHDTPKEELALSILKPLVETFHKYDPTRPVTQALFRPNTSHDYTNGLADLLDVIGTNYRDNELIQAWKDKPGRKIIGTEQGLDRSTWLVLRDNPQHSGQFLWAGIDYLGESLAWPAVNSIQGVIDRTGAFKPATYERQAWWSTKPMVKIERSLGADAPPAAEGRGGRGGRGGAAPGPVAQWTPRDPEHPIESTNITVFSNCDQVELFLNDKSLGSKPKAQDDSPRTWNGVAFEIGTIRAVAKNGDKVVATDEMRTAGKPAKIALSVERDKLAPTFDDVSFITVTVVDDKGVACPYAEDLISFKLDGPGVVAATDNGDPTAHESYQAPERKLFHGQCFAVIKATGNSGKITINASATGLAGSSATIEAIPAVR